jgi:hypothetical protein
MKMPELFDALRGYLGWTLRHGVPTEQWLVPEDCDIRKAVSEAPVDDPFFDLDPQIRHSLIECLDEYERPGASPFTQKAYRSLLTGVQSLYTEKIQIRISQDRREIPAGGEERS